MEANKEALMNSIKDRKFRIVSRSSALAMA